MRAWQTFSTLFLGAFCPLLAQETPSESDVLPKSSTTQFINENVILAVEKIDAEEILLKTSSTNSFRIVSENSFAFAPIRKIIQEAEKIILEYFGVEINSYAKINLQIIDKKSEEFNGQFAFEIINKEMYLSLVWDEELKYDEACNFIMGAMIRKILVERNRRDKLEDIPYFLELALSTLLEQRCSNALIVEYAKQASKYELLNLKELMQITKESQNKELNKLSAYWNVLALAKIYPKKSNMHKVYAALLSGEDKDEIYENFNKEKPSFDFERYFRCIVNFEISSRLGGIMSMEQSAEEVLRLCFIRKDSRNQSIADTQIFERSKETEVLAAIRARILEIKIILPFTNSIYFNSLISLGEMFEAAADGNKQAFNLARETFISEFKYAKQLELRANALLSE